MSRNRHLTTYDLLRLDLAVAHIERVWRGSTFLVGSVERGEQYRDVDVRTILDDETFDATFGGAELLWGLVSLGLTAWLREQTGLPIDYQIQRQTEANEKHTGPRNHLSGGHRVFAGGGDATPFAGSPEGSSLSPEADHA